MQPLFDAVECGACNKVVPVHRSIIGAKGDRICTSCARPDVVDEPIIYCSTANTPPWITAIGFVHFDLLLGQVLDVLYPPLPLSVSQETEVSFLCFPDANHVADGDSIHDFVFAYNASECDASRMSVKRQSLAADKSPSSAPSPSSSPKRGFDSSSTELFCSTLFRQKRDSSIERGAQQKALVVMSRYPFPSVSHQILRIVCAELWDTPGSDPESTLKAVYDEICSWPPPLPTNTYRLTLMNRELSPYTTPIYTAAQLESLRWSEVNVNASRVAWRAQLVDALVASDATWTNVKRALVVFLGSAGCTTGLRNALEEIVASAVTPDTERVAMTSILRQILEVNSERSGGEHHGHEGGSTSSGALLHLFRRSTEPPLRPDIVCIQNEALEQLQERAHAIVSSPSLSRAECNVNGPRRGKHLFHELEFHHAMRPHLLKLWKLWELLIIGAPLAVISFDAPTVTAICFSLASLFAPLHFGGVLRPYLTINNREVDLFMTEQAPPSTIVGVTNPFFVRKCMKWPHFLCLSKEVDEPATHKMMPVDSEKREKQQFKLKNRMFCSRHYLVKTEKTVGEITQEVSNGRSSPSSKGSFVDLNPSSMEGNSMRQVRQHFLDLTEEFLAPLKIIIQTNLRRLRPFFVMKTDGGGCGDILSEDTLLRELSSFQGVMPYSSFKTRADMLSVYKDFLQTNAFRVWCGEQYEGIRREVLLGAMSLEEVLLMNPQPSTRHLVLQALQEQLDIVISRPIVDLTLMQKLSALCSSIPALRVQLSIS
ncbi:Afi1 domain-containing protein, putative [Bodo saltans]|uniref:Afi1 domain-containing protein, putative n=1 Tax=Bodo saltans TaxID=75058 RepID=A0A0S4J175_BODSA|nr:Afi1 domain-containing protein, putative [Bodo saltans]|eukprot:CUG40886.1 Afi1 domain-containing protein, putative [Bodo saltans]